MPVKYSKPVHKRMTKFQYKIIHTQGSGRRTEDFTTEGRSVALADPEIFKRG